MIRFSVVIPSYNRSAWLVTALESVFAQTEPAFEIIVADDGSTDDTPDTLRKYEGRVKVLTQRNAGPAAARNLGIAAATGDYIAFLDSDDLWFPWTLALYREVIESHAQPIVPPRIAARVAAAALALDHRHDALHAFRERRHRAGRMPPVCEDRRLRDVDEAALGAEPQPQVAVLGIECVRRETARGLQHISADRGAARPERHARRGEVVGEKLRLET